MPKTVTEEQKMLNTLTYEENYHRDQDLFCESSIQLQQKLARQPPPLSLLDTNKQKNNKFLK